MGCGKSDLPVITYRSTGDWEGDIAQLYIPLEDVEKFLTKEDVDILQYGKQRRAGANARIWAVVLLIFAGLAFCGFLASREHYEPDNAIFFFVVFIILLLLIAIIIGTAIWRSAASSSREHELNQLASMWVDVERFNTTLANIHVVDRLQEAGNPVEVSSRSDVMDQLEETKTQLLRAFKTYAILRDNPDFEWGMHEITSLIDNRAVRNLENRAGDLAEAYSSALEIEMNARKVLNSLRERE
jgi:hypothetical protein